MPDPQRSSRVLRTIAAIAVIAVTTTAGAFAFNAASAAHPSGIFSQVGSTVPGSSSPGSTAPGTTAPGTTTPGSSAPGTTTATTTVTTTGPTTPPSTVAPTSTPANPQPVPTPAGPLPELAPGQSLLMIDGVPTPVNVKPNPAGTALIVSTDDFSFTVGATDSSGKVLPLAGDGSIQIPPGGQAAFQATEFAPNTPIYGWLFSDPVYLGASNVAGSGTAAGAMTIATGTSLGAHTVQFNGTTITDQIRSISLGIRVAAAAASTTPTTTSSGSSALPVTGTTLALLPVGLLLLGAGGAILVTRRRRRAAR